jgi:hypothetical protein
MSKILQYSIHHKKTTESETETDAFIANKFIKNITGNETVIYSLYLIYVNALNNRSDNSSAYQ